MSPSPWKLLITTVIDQEQGSDSINVSTDVLSQLDGKSFKALQ